MYVCVYVYTYTHTSTIHTHVVCIYIICKSYIYIYIYNIIVKCVWFVEHLFVHLVCDASAISVRRHAPADASCEHHKL